MQFKLSFFKSTCSEWRGKLFVIEIEKGREKEKKENLALEAAVML